MKSDCPDCAKPIYGNECKSCGWRVSLKQSLDNNEKNQIWWEHNQCCYEYNFRRCKLVGNVSYGTSFEYRKDTLGKYITGPYYCMWHFESMTGNSKSFQDFSNFVDEWQKQSFNQFSGKTKEYLWKMVSGA